MSPLFSFFFVYFGFPYSHHDAMHLRMMLCTYCTPLISVHFDWQFRRK